MEKNLVTEIDKIIEKCREIAKTQNGKYQEGVFLEISNQADIIAGAIYFFFSANRSANVTDRYGNKIVLNNQEDVNKLEKAKAEVIRYLNMSLFYTALSSIEFCLKEIIKEKNNEKLLACLDRSNQIKDEFKKIEFCNECTSKMKSLKKKIDDMPPMDMMAKIINKSRKEGYLTQEEEKIMITAFEIRNCCMHNNARAWKTKDEDIIIDGRKFIFKEGKMIEAPLDSFLFLLDKVIDITDVLIKKM